MVEIIIAGPRDDSGNEPSIEAEVPALPRVGDHISHDASGVSGYVRSVSFWWDESDNLTIKVSVR